MATDARIAISVVINTFNEEHRLPNALRSVQGWADEIVVVDMQSDDATKEVARVFGARVFDFERMGYGDPAREFAISQASNDWVFILDADEVAPRELLDCLKRIAAKDEVDVVIVPRQNYALGRPMTGAGIGPTQDAYPRFFKKHSLHVTSQIHNFFHPRPNARVLQLSHEGERAIVHFAYESVTGFFSKTNRYTSIEAETLVTSGTRSSIWRLFWLPVREFIKRFVYRNGMRDGMHGLAVSLLHGCYVLIRELKLIQFERFGTDSKIAEEYRLVGQRYRYAAFDNDRPAERTVGSFNLDTSDSKQRPDDRIGA